MYAALKGNNEVIALLLMNDPPAKTSPADKVRSKLSDFSNHVIYLFLIKSKDGQTALFHACHNGHYACASLLLFAGSRADLVLGLCDANANDEMWQRQPALRALLHEAGVFDKGLVSGAQYPFWHFSIFVK